MSNTRETIFISGNPDLFPLEYYNKNEKCYQGVVPSLMEEFSESSDYEIVYMNHKGKDNRKDDYNNFQADMISGISLKNMPDLNNDEELITLLTSNIDGNEYSFSILITLNASNKFKEQFKTFMDEVYANNKTTELISMNSKQHKENQNKVSTYFTLNIVMIVLIFGFIVYFLGKKIKRLKESELRDSLTGIHNYAYLAEQYPKLITEHTRVMYHAVFIDVNTEAIYKTATRSDVEDFIVYTSSVLCNCTDDENDIVVKLTDDKFVVFKYFTNAEDIYKWTEKTMDIIEEYSLSRKKYFKSKAWAGLYELKRSDVNLDEILEKAKYSSAYARENDLTFAKCNEEIYNIYYERAKLEERIKTALMNDEFEPYLWLIKSTRTGEIEGAEVVSRWQHPYRGLLLPEEYIDILEENLQIQFLDFKMIEKSCAMLEKIYNGKEDAVLDFFITCNCSRKTIWGPEFVNEFFRIINDYKFPKQALIIEVNALRNYSGRFETENDIRIKESGVRLVRDDFGTDNTELSKLQFEQYDGIKIDKILVRQIDDKCENILVKSSVNMCHEMNKVVFAEGVLDEHIEQMLTTMGVDYVQGSHISYPLPEKVAFKVLNEKNVFQH